MWWFKRQNGVAQSTLEQLGSLESELLERLWAMGEVSVRDLHGEFSSRLAYTTVMTTLDRLYKKGVLDRRKFGNAYLYAARFTPEEHRERMAQHLIGMFLGEKNESRAVLSCFVDVVTESDREMLDHLDQLVKAKRRALRRPAQKTSQKQKEERG